MSGNLYFLIRAWLEDHPLGQVYYPPYDVVFSHFDVVEPILVSSNERAAAVVTAKHVTGAPEIVSQIGSRGRASAMTRSSAGSTAIGGVGVLVMNPELDVVRVYHRRGRVSRPPSSPAKPVTS